MKKIRRKSKRPNPTLSQWLMLIQALIAKHSTRPRVRGPYKGHSSTNSVAWVAELTQICSAHIARRNKGRAYDGNMALAAMLGLLLSAWYTQVHRAKGFDPARPLQRRQVFRRLALFRSQLAVATTDERIMGTVWGSQQAWNFPFGKGAYGGSFV